MVPEVTASIVAQVPEVQLAAMLPEVIASIVAPVPKVQLAADITHVVAVLYVIRHMQLTKSSEDVSMKTQAIYLLIFLSRYLDFIESTSLYLKYGKIFFVASSAVIVFMVAFYKPRGAENHDTYRLIRILLPSLVWAILLDYNGPLFVRLYYPSHYTWTQHIARIGVTNLITNVLWTFSKLLEGFAILPQVHLVRRQASFCSFTLGYISLLALYTLLYEVKAVQWWIMYQTIDTIAVITRLMQLTTYAIGLWTCSRIKPITPLSEEVVGNGFRHERIAQLETLDEKMLI